MKKKFLSNAPPAMSNAPPMNAIELGIKHTATTSASTALNDTTGATLIGNG